MLLGIPPHIYMGRNEYITLNISSPLDSIGSWKLASAAYDTDISAIKISDSCQVLSEMTTLGKFILNIKPKEYLHLSDAQQVLKER